MISASSLRSRSVLRPEGGPIPHRGVEEHALKLIELRDIRKTYRLGEIEVCASWTA